MMEAFAAPAAAPLATLPDGFSGAADPTEAAVTYDASPVPVAVLLDMAAYVSGNLTTKRWADRGLIYPDNTMYEARLKNRVTISSSAVDSLVLGACVAQVASQMEIANTDRALDDIVNDGLAVGRGVTVKTMPAPTPAASDAGGGNLSGSTTIFTGIVGSFGAVGDTVTLQLSDLSERLNTPLQTNFYDGEGDLGGTPDLKGLPKPISLGFRKGVTPVYLSSVDLGDGALPTYQSHWRAIDGHTAVRERGVAMVQTSSVPGIGEWKDFPDDGCFQLGFTPDGIITCDVRGDSEAGDYAASTSTVTKRCLTSVGAAFTLSDIDSPSFARVGTRIPGEVGWGYGTEVISQRDAIQQIVSHCGVWLACNRAGKFRLAIAAPQWEDVQFTLDPYDILSLRPLPLPAALQPTPNAVEVTGAVNWTPLTDIAGSVSDEDRADLAAPSRRLRAESTVIAARQTAVRTMSLDGLYRYESDAQGRADDVRDWLEGGLRMLEVVTDRYRGKIEHGMVGQITTYPRHNLTGGFSGIVCGWSEVAALGRTTIILIGPST